MNLTGQSKGSLLFVNFNQDATCLSVGTTEGFRVCNTQPQFTEVYSQEMGGVGVCEMLFCSSLVALVGCGDDPSLSPRRLHIVNTKNKSTICELNFVTPILAVKLNKKRMIVVMETKIHIYDISTMKILHSLDTATNPKGICALSASEENCYLAYPAAAEKGDIVIFDALTLQTLNIIHAHKGPLSKLTINFDGTLIASCSKKGTVIRVYSIPEGNKYYQFRRGSYPATVHSIAFSNDSSLLCVSSDTGTVHIFKVDQSASEVNGKSSSVSAYLPPVLSEMWDTIPVRSFATVRLTSGVENICAINQTNTLVMIATADGYFYHYTMDPKVGGELLLSSEHKLISSKLEESPHLVNLAKHSAESNGNNTSINGNNKAINGNGKSTK